MPKELPLSVFCSYSQKDEKLRAQFATGLAPLIVDGWIAEMWYDRKIQGGEDWEREIDKHLQQADVILLLISFNFIASKYIMGKEIKIALERHQRGDARLIPIILTPVSAITALNHLQALPHGQKPLSTDNRKVNLSRLKEVSESIEGILTKLCSNGVKSNGNAPDVHGPSPVLEPRETVLAQLCNRLEQDRQLQEAWRQHVTSIPRRPFLCLVHGSVQEDHAGYLKRLTAYSLPQAIGMGPDSQIFATLPLKWPDSTDQATFSSLMLTGLTQGLNCQPLEVAAKLYQLGEVSVVYCDLFSSSPNYLDAAVIQSFFEFWAAWPDLPVRQKLVVVLCVQYRPGYPAGFPKSQTEAFAKAVMDRSISAVVLDELPSISKENVREWIRRQEIRKYCDVEKNFVPWEMEIEDTFRDQSAMPMGLLVGALNRMLKLYQRRLL
jgi:hypothetical protein